jgi:D-glycero-D-manno-heptose 1,7-bisphosphate phosphatase
MSVSRAIFFDKDGVMNTDRGVYGITEEPEFLPGIDSIISSSRFKGFQIIVVTNQPAVARGIVSEESLTKLLDAFKKKLAHRNNNAIIDSIYYCPHHPNADLQRYRLSCSCRKPKPGMILQACADLNIDPRKSYMVGDRISDVIAGHLAGCTTIQFLSGQHDNKMIDTDLIVDYEIKPDFTITDLSQLEDIIK